MFSDFKKAFKETKDLEKEIPKEVLKYLNEELPDDFYYQPVGKGACVLQPSTEKLKMDVQISLPENMPKDFKPTTLEELMEFVYRTQQELRIVPDEEGHIKLNGEKVKVDQLVKIPLKDMVIDFSDFIIKPQPFQPAFPVPIETEMGSHVFMFQRQPLADMKKSLFKSVDDSVLEVSYILDERSMSINVSFNVNISKSSNANDILNGLKIYDSISKGKVKFAGADLNYNVSQDITLDEAIILWDKICTLEETLSVKFEIEHPIESEDIIWVEKLYSTLVENVPYKQYVSVNDLTVGDVDILSEDGIVDKKEMMFEYIQSSLLEIWNVEIELYEAVGLFNIMVSGIEKSKEDDQHIIKLKSVSDEGTYQIIKHFLTKSEAESYRKKLHEVDREKINEF